MRIYLDVCCLNRPHDDQAQLRVRFETEAVIGILKRCECGQCVWVLGEAVEVEVLRDPLSERRRKTVASLEHAAEHAALDDRAHRRAAELRAFGLKPGDALHVALAESAGCDVLLTTDDRLIRAARRIAPPVALRVQNPLEWWQENAE